MDYKFPINPQPGRARILITRVLDLISLWSFYYLNLYIFNQYRVNKLNINSRMSIAERSYP